MTRRCTNLPRTPFSADLVARLYRCRWQIERCFKECKSYANLHTFNTANPHVAEGLMWASLCAAMLKRFLARAAQRVGHGIAISTRRVAMCAHHMLEALVTALLIGIGLLGALRGGLAYLLANARRPNLERDRRTGRLREFGVDAVWLGSGSYTAERLAWLRAQQVQAYAEFSTLHVADYLKTHPDTLPVGTDGRVSPAPDGWQGICPTHEGYRAERMRAFRTLLETFAIDGVWLDYHHAHASWEQARPNMPDTCFCDRCLGRFQQDTGITLPQAPASERSAPLLSTHRAAWVRWRLGVFTDWVREFRDIRNATRPNALLGTFHNPWSDDDLGGARREKLAIDLKAQAAYLDVFSPMPYHARFGHAADPAWISRQVAWLGQHLGVRGVKGERLRIWPIVQISDWGEPVPLEQVDEVLRHGARAPATGVKVFAWGGLRAQPQKIEAIGWAFRALAASE